MCQISVYVEREGVEELLQEDVTNLTVSKTGVNISSLFAGSQELANTVVQSIAPTDWLRTSRSLMSMMQSSYSLI